MVRAAPTKRAANLGRAVPPLRATPYVSGVTCAVSATTPILSIRPKALLAGVANEGNFHPRRVVLYSASFPVFLTLQRGGDLTGPSLG